MKFNYLFIGLLAFAASFALFSCSDNDDNDGGGGGSSDSNITCYVLNQGNSGENNASLQTYNSVTGTASSAECENDIFRNANGELLGDVAQDLLWVGDRLFVTVSNSQKLEVLDTDGKLLKRHQYAAEGASPRNLATDGKNVYVTNYDGFVYVYNAVTGDSVTQIYSGSYPEGIAYNKGRLVVNNSNWGGYGGGEASVAVIDVASLSVVCNIKENVCNPYGESVVCDGEVYIVDSGNYADIPSKICRVDVAGEKLVEVGRGSYLSTDGEYLYFVDASFSYEIMGYNYSPLYRMDVSDGTSSALLPVEKMSDIYSLDVDPATGNVYVGYAQYGVPGTMRVYDGLSGEQLSIFEVGYFPAGARFAN
jgi:YVTN family beta-propeller protein